MDLRRILHDDAVLNKPSPDANCPLRNGKWTEEEERFAAALSKHFVAGELSVQSGISLRSFLAKKLRCSPMRVSTKLSMEMLGDMKIPKKLGQKRFFPVNYISLTHRELIRQELDRLEIDFHRAAEIKSENEEDDGSSSEAIAPGSPIRIGSWSHEEQTYASALIEGFLLGLVDVAEGMTLRAYLAERLCCNPMRISKKLSTCKMGSMVIPRRIGSTLFARRTMDAHLTAEGEQQLERLRQSCFPTAPKRKFQHGYDSPELPHDEAECPQHDHVNRLEFAS